ncbi:MAG: M14 metallopeptidase family protein [Gemmatimonadaceae bacterium]
MRVRSVAVALALFLTLPASTHAQSRKVPTPASVIGFDPGTDRKLPEWNQVVAYFKALDAASPRVQLRVLGKTTLGRPFIAAFISDSSTLANLPRVHQAQRKLSDPRLTTEAERIALERDGKVVVMVTSSIHSIEVGGILTLLTFAYRLATSEDPEAQSIRKNTVVIIVPSLNPDGVDIVGNWYRSSLGTQWEGSQPPTLYHYYTGHDNNRDWYAFTQVETQMVIDSLYSQWHPQIVNDIHQQGSNGTRIFIPPYMDPIEPNIDPILAAGVAQMGKSMTWRLTMQGLVGVANNTSYDAWTPARAYQHYHGAIRILTETASASLATPISVPFESLRAGYNVDPKVTGVDFLTRWQGGKWTIGDIVKYQLAASWALLAQAADDRALWLSSYSKVEENSVAGRTAAGRSEWPSTIVIPAQPARDTAVNFALRILQRGQVEIRRASAVFSANGRAYPAGSYLISTAQPYGGFAKTLLENQHYPDLHEYPGGPPKRPYDVVAHTLPLLFGFDVAYLPDPVAISSTPLSPVSATPWVANGLTNNKSRRIAIFANASPSMDEGWTRWVFDQYKIPFTTISARDIRAGNLGARFDAIILPDQQSSAIANGPNGAYPDSLKGGVGAAGATALGAFVDDGGTLVAFNDASGYAIEALSLPVKDELAGLSASDFYAPGSILRVVLDRTSPLTAGYTAPEQAVWFEGSPAFSISDPSRATAVASYPASTVDPLMSGWLLGGKKLAGKAAMVDVKRGKGHVILFGFRPQYRAQTMATYPLLWNALLK